MVEAAAAAVPEGAVLTRHAATRIALTDAGVAVTTQTAGSETTFEAARAVLALPPRLAAGLGFTPALPPHARAALAAVPGWMAGQAKALAVYERPFWREAGLSGSAFSDAGPLGEMHDATLPGEAEGALFGFFTWPPALREARREALPELIARQLAALFGPEAARPRELVIHDWSREPFTATPADQDIPEAHPPYRPLALPPPWHGRVLLAGAEMAPEFGGYLEGALAAAEAALDALAVTRPGGPAAR
jgi:monoamine oxidase